MARNFASQSLWVRVDSVEYPRNGPDSAGNALGAASQAHRKQMANLFMECDPFYPSPLHDSNLRSAWMNSD